MSPIRYHILPFSDHSIYISLGNDISKDCLWTIRAILNVFSTNQPIGFIEAVPGYNNITVYYDPIKIHQKSKTINVQNYFIDEITNLLNQIEIDQYIESNIVKIPVCYDEFFGTDLAFVAENNHLTIEEVIKIHSETKYTVHMLGFSPGFPYLGGMSPKIAAPRKSTPSIAIAAGSVGIAGQQTGIYPVETPGGWQIIGRTPIPLFNLKNDSPSLLNTGDIVQFYPISLSDFYTLEEFYNDYSA